MTLKNNKLYIIGFKNFIIRFYLEKPLNFLRIYVIIMYSWTWLVWQGHLEWNYDNMTSTWSYFLNCILSTVITWWFSLENWTSLKRVHLFVCGPASVNVVKILLYCDFEMSFTHIDFDKDYNCDEIIEHHLGKLTLTQMKRNPNGLQQVN